MSDTVNKRFREGIALRHVDAESIAHAVRSVDPIGSGTDRLARRLQNGIENRKAGFHNGRPLTLLLASGFGGEPDLIARAIAEAVIGRDLDGAPLVEIQAEHYIGEGDLLGPLLGPPKQGDVAPLLDERRLFSPYVLNRKGREIQPLRQFMQRVEGEILPMLNAQGQQAQQQKNTQRLAKLQGEIFPGVMEIYQEAQSRLGELYQEVSPRMAVIYISGLEHIVAAHGSRNAQAFRQLLMRMCADGYAEVRGSGKTALQDCIIIGSYASMDPLGSDGASSQEIFQKIVGELYATPIGEEILSSFGGERSLIVVEPPTEESQRIRLEEKIADLEQKLLDHFGISLGWHSEVVAAILARAKDPDRKGHYPSSRLDARFDELVLGSLADLVNGEHVYQGCHIGFTLIDGMPKAMVDATDPRPSDAEAITPDAIREVFSRETAITFHVSDEVKSLNERLYQLLEEDPAKDDDTTQSGLYL